MFFLRKILGLWIIRRFFRFGMIYWKFLELRSLILNRLHRFDRILHLLICFLGHRTTYQLSVISLRLTTKFKRFNDLNSLSDSMTLWFNNRCCIQRETQRRKYKADPNYRSWIMTKFHFENFNVSVTPPSPNVTQPSGL